MRIPSNKWSSLNQLHSFSINLPNDMYFQYSIDISSSISFLQAHFSPYLKMSYNTINYHLSNPSSTNISLIHQGAIIGFIHSRPIHIKYNDISQNINYVEYLCVQPSYRGYNIASIMISSLINRMNSISFDISRIYLFKKDGDKHPFSPFITSQYLCMSLNNHSSNNNYHDLSNNTHSDIYNDWLNKANKHKFTIISSLEQWLNDMSIRQSYIVNINNQSFYIIGQTSTFNNIYKVFDIEYIIPTHKKTNNTWQSLLSFLKFNKYSYITMNNISDYKNIINNNWNIGNSFQYYLYNGISPHIENTDIFLTIN